MSWDVIESARRIFSEKTGSEKMIEKAKADFIQNSVIARGAQATAKIAEWQSKGWIGAMYKDGRVYINPFTPINDEVFIGLMGMDGLFMKGDMLYRVNYSNIDQKISVDAVALGASRAAWLVPIAQGTVMFCCAVMGGFLGMGVVLTVVTTANQLVVLAQYFFQNEKKFHDAMDSIKPVYNDLLYLKDHCPETYKLFIAVLFRDKTSEVESTKYISDFIKSNAKDAGSYVGKLLAGNVGAATVAAAKQTVISVTLASLISFRTVLKEVIKQRGALKLAGDAKAALGVLSEINKVVSGKDKGEINEAFIKKVLGTGCGTTPEVTQKIDNMARNVGAAITLIEEIKKELDAKSI